MLVMSKSKNNLMSTSALAKRLELSSKVLFQLLKDKGWIDRVGEQWKLTGKGQFEGGDYIQSKKFGEYIGWPESIIEHKVFDELFNRPLRTRIIAEDVGISSHRFNALLVERGWQKSFHRGWVLTSEGRRIGGSEGQDEETGVPYTLWPREILNVEWLQVALAKLKNPAFSTLPDQATEQTPEQPQAELGLDFEEHTPPYNTMDGHAALFVEDALVDNWLYLMGVTHCYRYQMPDESLGLADFYLPSSQVYIEVWHKSEKQGEQGQAISQKLARLDYYKKNGANLIEIQSDTIDKLDQTLPKALLGFGITVY